MKQVINLKKIKKELDKNAIVEIKNFINSEDLKNLQNFFYIEGQKDWDKFSYPNKIDYEKVRTKLLKEIENQPQIKEIFESVHTYLFGKKSPDKTYFPNLRIFYGEVGENESYNFHFDSYVLTILMPIIIPKERNQKNGDLMIFKRRRLFHRIPWLNLLQKVLLQNYLSRFLLKTKILRKFFGMKIVKLKPGNIYLFLGYQTIHGNRTCNNKFLRATGCFHYSNPIL